MDKNFQRETLMMNTTIPSPLPSQDEQDEFDDFLEEENDEELLLEDDVFDEDFEADFDEIDTELEDYDDYDDYDDDDDEF